jgi:hypothetical protein
MRSNVLLKKRITQASLLMSMLLGAGSAQANDPKYIYQLEVDGKAKVPVWLVINNIYGIWSNVGGNYNCATWTPPEGTITWGDEFQQARICNQNQERDVTPVLMNPILKTSKQGDVYQEGQVINVTQYNPAIGTLDYVVGERAANWGTWIDAGGNYACDDWTPSTETVNLFENFTQKRDCSQNQTRSRQVFNVWASGDETPKRVDPDAQTIIEEQLQVVQGTRDFIDGQSIKTWSPWLDTGAFYDCAVWSPSTDTINLDEPFSQDRICSQDQNSDRDIYDVWASGRETFASKENRDQTVNVSQSQESIGTQDYIIGDEALAWSTWSDQGASYACDNWSPAPLGQTANYTQNRVCSQDQLRTRTINNVWRSGRSTFSSTETGNGTVDTSQSRDVTISYSTWTNSGGQSACGAWSPVTSAQTGSFTQTQSCSQGQVRDRIYSVGSTVISTASNASSQTVSVTNSRTVNVSAGSWSNTSTSNFGSWTPNPTTQTADFTQTRSYRQNRERTWNYSDGNTRTETDYTNQSQNRTVSISYSAWTNSGGQFSCGSWSPNASSQTSNFTQTQSCSQNQVRNRIYSVGSTVIGTTNNASSQTISVSNSRTVSVSLGSWATTNTSNYGSWTPATTTQTSNFTQTRSYTQNFARTWTYSAGGGILSSRVETTSSGQSQSRTISVSVGGWSNTSATNYGSWTPTPTTQTSNFTQTRSYRQNRQRTWTYSDNNTRTETGYTNQSQSQTVTVSWSGWSNYQGVSNCSSWSPATNTRQQGVSFTQERYCDQGRVRTRSYSTGQSASEYVTIRVRQTQSAFGTDIGVTGQSAGAWRNTGGIYSCSSYSPAASTVDWGQNYTATRTCSQNQYRDVVSTISYADGSSSQSTTRQTQVARPTSTTSSVGTRNYIVRTESVFSHYAYGSPYNCGSWGPAPSTVNSGQSFTQTRTCSRTRSTYNDIYTVYASGYRPMTTSNTFVTSVAQSVNYTQTAVGTKITLRWVLQPGITCPSNVLIDRNVFSLGGEECPSEGMIMRVSEGEPCWGSGYMAWTYRCE